MPEASKVIRNKRGEDVLTAWLKTLGLKGLFLSGMQLTIDRAVVPKGAEKKIETQFRHDLKFEQADALIKGMSAFSVQASAEGSEKPYFKLEGGYDVLFSAEAGGELDESRSQALARTVYMMVWPYVRELSDGMSSRAGVPVPLPPLITPDEVEKKDED